MEHHTGYTSYWTLSVTPSSARLAFGSKTFWAASKQSGIKDERIPKWRMPIVWQIRLCFLATSRSQLCFRPMPYTRIKGRLLSEYSLTRWPSQVEKGFRTNTHLRAEKYSQHSIALALRRHAYPFSNHILYVKTNALRSTKFNEENISDDSRTLTLTICNKKAKPTSFDFSKEPALRHLSRQAIQFEGFKSHLVEHCGTDT